MRAGSVDAVTTRGKGGLRRRVGTLVLGDALRALSLPIVPTVLVLDEPTDTLDADAVAFLRAAIAAHRERGGTVLVATHRPDEDGLAADEAIVLAAGRPTRRAG